MSYFFTGRALYVLFDLAILQTIACCTKKLALPLPPQSLDDQRTKLPPAKASKLPENHNLNNFSKKPCFALG